MIDEIESYLLFALIMWINVSTIGELLASLSIGWTTLFVISLLQ